MSHSITEMVHEIIRLEGGLVDDKDDPGGITNKGVSLRYAKGIGLDLDGDGDTDADDIVLVDHDKAVELFLEDFYRSPQVDRLPPMIQPHMFDFSVNSGAPRAIMTMQDVLNDIIEEAPELGYLPLMDDGRMGPKSRRAAEIAQEAMGKELNNVICKARLDFMRRIARKNPKLNKYLVRRDGGKGGWVTRVEGFLL
ncbi:glycoside hydrolase family 108 protein [Kiloniella sp.]|uniref:glycoside hydrolase family 108 protein n=1 Tax=Kiloniella sp. TaxID=1938587 RepID=UPI003B025EF1